MSCKSIEIQSEFGWATHAQHTAQRKATAGRSKFCRQYNSDLRFRSDDVGVWFSLQRCCRFVAMKFCWSCLKLLDMPMVTSKRQYNSDSVTVSLSLSHTIYLAFTLDAQIPKVSKISNWEFFSLHKRTKLKIPSAFLFLLVFIIWNSVENPNGNW